jgi:hypothetical protein
MLYNAFTLKTFAFRNEVKVEEGVAIIKKGTLRAFKYKSEKIGGK